MNYRNGFVFSGEFDVKDDLKYWHRNPTIRKVLSKISNESRLLDFGAGDKRLERILRKCGWEGVYKSLDKESMHYHDYSSIDEIADDKFDVVCLFEVIEHLTLDDTLFLLERIYSIIRPKGYLFLSTPNIYHINQLWKSDITHVQQYPGRDIYSILRLIGFSANYEAYRINIRIYENIRRRFKKILKKYLCRILEVDHAEGIFFMIQR